MVKSGYHHLFLVLYENSSDHFVEMKKEDLDNLEPIPITDSEIEFPKLTISTLNKKKAIKYLSLFIFLSLFPVLFTNRFPERIKVQALKKQQIDSIIDAPSNKFIFFINNLNSFNDFIITSFQAFTNDQKVHEIPMTVTRSFVLSNWQNSQPKKFSKIIKTNSSKPFQFFSDFIHNVQIARIVSEFDQNITISALNCFIEYTPKASIYFNLFIQSGFTILVFITFLSLTHAIEQNGLIYPSQFVTQFYLVPILICNLPLDIFRPFISVKLIRIIKSVFDIVATETTLAIEIWYIMLLTKRDSKPQQKVTLLTFISVGISFAINLFYSLYQTLFSKDYVFDFYFPYISNYISMIIILCYSYWITKQASDDPNTSRMYLSFICLTNILIIFIDCVSFLERHIFNWNLSFTLKISTRLSIALLLSYLHWPIDKSHFVQKTAKKEQIKRSQYTKYIGGMASRIPAPI